MKYTLQTALCSLLLGAVLWGCDQNRLEVDVSNIPVEVDVERLDSLWPVMTPVSFRANHPRLLQHYPEVYRHYIEDVLQLGSVDDSNLFASIRSFVTHPDFAEVFKEVNAHYSDISWLEQEMEIAWKHYAYYFPEAIIPNHMTCAGGFNSPYIMTEGGIGICLELFLGADCRFYDYLQWPQYQRQRMTPKHVVPWMMKGWLETEYPNDLEQTNLLQDIVHQGKILYALDALLPEVEDSIKIGYTHREMLWANQHEIMVWAHFVDNELLFSHEASLKSKFTNDGPFTVDLVKESPSRMGHYIGWQLVRAYMEQQETIDLPALMRTDAQQILNESKYKP